MKPAISVYNHLYWLLWQLPFMQAKNQLRRVKMDTVVKNLVLFSFTVMVAWAEFVFFNQFWTVLGRVPFGLSLILPHLFSYMGSFLFAFLAYSSVLTALSALYRSTDLHLLLTLPVRLMPVLFAKWLDVAFRSGATLVLLMIPPMISLQQHLGLSNNFFLIYLPSLLALAAIAISVGFVIALLMMLLFPARRMHQTVAVLGLIMATLMIMAVRFLHLENLWSENAQSSPLLLFLQQEPQGWMQYAPGELFANSVASYIFSGTRLWQWFSLTLLLGAASVFLSLLLGKLFFMRGWWKSQEQADPAVAQRTVSSREFWYRLPFSAVLRAMLWKDWLILIRDPSVWTQLFMMIPLAALYLLNISFLPKQEPAIQPLLAVANVGLVGLIIAAIGARFLFPAASREGRAVWIPLVSPMRPLQFLIQKSLFVLPPVLLLSLLLLLLSGWLLSISSSLMIWCLVYGMVLILLIGVQAIGLGIWFPSFRYHHLLEVSLGKGAFLYMVLALLETGTLVYLAYRRLFSGEATALPLSEQTLLLWMAGWSLITLLILNGGLRKMARPEL